MRRAAFPLILAGTFAVAALGAHTVGSNAAPTRIVDVDHDDRFETPSAAETPDPSATPDAPDDGRTTGPSSSPSSDDGPSASSTPDAPDDSDGRSDDDDSGHGGDDDDRSGPNSGKG